MRCRECGGSLTLNGEGYYVCTSCGLVQDIPPLEPGYEDRKYMGPVSLGGLENGSVVDSDPRLSRLNMYARMDGLRSMEYKALRSYELVASRLGLPRHVRERAVTLYLKTLRLLSSNPGLLGGRKVNHYRLLAAATIASSRESNYPLREREVIRAFREAGHNVHRANVMEALWLMRRLSVLRDSRDLGRMAAEYLRVLLGRARLDGRRDRVYREALERCAAILRALDRRRVQGRNPRIVALAVALKALREVGARYGLKASLSEAARASGYSASAIRSNMILISRLAVAGYAGPAPRGP